MKKRDHLTRRIQKTPWVRAGNAFLYVFGFVILVYVAFVVKELFFGR